MVAIGQIWKPGIAGSTPNKEVRHGIFPHQKDIPFMRHALVFNVISLITFIPRLLSSPPGPHLSVEFTGGTLVEVKYEQAADLEKIRKRLTKAFNDLSRCRTSVPRAGRDDPPAAQGRAEHQRKVGESEMASLATPGLALPSRVEFVGPQVGKEPPKLAPWHCCWSSSASSSTWPSVSNGASGVGHHRQPARRDHHPGFFAFFQWEFSLSVLAAVLAVLGYSVNESVVVFDRVRETFKKVRGLTTPQVLDHAITSTISGPSSPTAARS